MSRSSIVTTGILVVLTLLSQPENTTTHATPFMSVADSLIEVSMPDTPIIKAVLIDSLNQSSKAFEIKLQEAEKVNSQLKKENKIVKKQAVQIEKLVDIKLAEDSAQTVVCEQDSIVKKETAFSKLLRSLKLKK